MRLKARNRRSKKGLSPVISTVIITGTIIALVTVAIVFANNFLSARMAESDFNSAKQFMQTIGLQIDDVAWKIGQRETVRYSSRYGFMDALNTTLTYTIRIKTADNPNVWQDFASYDTGVIMLNMPTSQYTISNNYYRQIWPAQITTPTLKGSSMPVSRVFEIEKIPMYDGNYLRVVTAPVIRVINSTITTGSNSTYYFKFYLPLLTLRNAPRMSQSVTLTGDAISVKTQNRITSINVTVSFPRADFDNTFFHFPNTSEVINAPAGYDLPGKDCVLEFYTGLISTDLGVHV